ncbi:MAG: CAP domain-containing protein, partial [Patescibacteria group bacterium]
MKISKKCKEIIPFKVAIMGLMVLIILIGSVPVLRNSVLDSISAIYGAVLVNLTNQNRIAANISELKVSPILEKAAQMKADDMASKNYFAH